MGALGGREGVHGQSEEEEPVWRVAKPDGDRGGKGYLCKMKCSKPSALPVGTHGGKRRTRELQKSPNLEIFLKMDLKKKKKFCHSLL